jgi:hypothetical protein
MMGVGEYAAIQVEHSPWIKGQGIRAQSRSILATVKTTHNNTRMDSGRLFLGDGEPQWQPYWYSSYFIGENTIGYGGYVDKISLTDSAILG